MPLVALRDEALGYGAGAVLRQITLSVAPGERVVLLGRSGAGKSTLLGALHDRIVGGGHRVALVPQDHALVPQLSVRHNVLMGRLDDRSAAYNLTSLLRVRSRDRAEIDAILDRVGLGEEAPRAVEGLSGGQKQRTALARALYRGGAALIADEPVSAVDEGQAGRLLDEMSAAFGTAILALHDVGQARAFATRLIGLRGGRIAFDAAPGEIGAGELERLYAA
ncbi:phosphonate transport system ATP-binding protein [Wenxinia saemankumensis]|uniref:Phosphonate transport system ATP-binding protein n=1 Tax=Wenxinia saemankumensis TaxID=1447782 RepID=A0A1M6ACR1_9RHOB|nr:ATP-binding cassette domain-containing protein [Wenxinia saemankumensis]SHI34255.1 phosphonate transport system ATP-binding protein [Wenxinia saemankumensis]